jgi:hypothetical protein
MLGKEKVYKMEEFLRMTYGRFSNTVCCAFPSLHLLPVIISIPLGTNLRDDYVSGNNQGNKSAFAPCNLALHVSQVRTSFNVVAM